MIEFKEIDLYPLLDFDSYTYQEAKDHAVLVDDYLGFNCEFVEAAIRQGSKKAAQNQQNWEHLSVQAMQTPYVEIHGILNLLKPQPGETLVDLGAAYGRMGFVMDQHFPEVKFYGYEIEVERVLEAQRVMQINHVESAKMIAADLTAADFSMPVADYYFIFDYGHERDVRRTLDDLRIIARSNPIQVVARGRLSRALIHSDHPWLSSVYQPMHFSHFSIYRS